MHIQVVNLNNLKYTKNLIKDLESQDDKDFGLTIIDQNSTEYGTKEFLESLQYEVIRNKSNIPLNHLWNMLYNVSCSDLLCFLNNDMRISHNFVSDTKRIFESEPKVGVVIHSTNHPDYRTRTKLNYVILEEKIVQGWDFTIRSELYEPIPQALRFFGGDDWLFNKIYEGNWKVAVALSSPVVHYRAQTHKYYTGNREEENRILREVLGIKRLSYKCKYSRYRPKE